MIRTGITGVSFPTDMTAPVEVPDNPDTRWGWFCNGLNIKASPSRAAVYTTAARVANRAQDSVQIYADTGSGWTQVDTVPAPEVELCEWWPEQDAPATGVPGEGCGKPATLSIGASTNWHVCDDCRKAPSLRRLSIRRRLA